MKASFQVRPDLTIEVEGETHKDLFRELAGAAEVFGERTCGLCGSAEIVPAYRTVAGQGKKTFEYPEWHCQGCGARLTLGCMVEGGRLFPHRKLDASGKPDREHGTTGPHRGWTHYRGESTEANGRAPQAPAATITAEQWAGLQAELKRHRIGDPAFLERFGFTGPRTIPAARYAELLAVARNPDAQLLAAQKRLAPATRKAGTP